jgi:hypothetical protein
MLCRLARKYHQGWSFFFSEKEYVNNLYEEDGEDDSVIVAQLEKLNSNFNMEKHFNVNNKNLMDAFLALKDPENKFITTRFTITTIIAVKGGS